jgi:hypothetical protein
VAAVEKASQPAERNRKKQKAPAMGYKSKVRGLKRKKKKKKEGTRHTSSKRKPILNQLLIDSTSVLV